MAQKSPPGLQIILRKDLKEMTVDALNTFLTTESTGVSTASTDPPKTTDKTTTTKTVTFQDKKKEIPIREDKLEMEKTGVV